MKYISRLWAPVSRRGARLARSLRTSEGYSLLEIMIVIVIIGVLALIAIPKFMGVTARAKMVEAKTMLKQVYTLQQAHLYERDVYGSSLPAIGFEASELVTGGGTARYVIAIEEAGAASFTATATSVVDFDGDGTMNVWEVGPSGVIHERVPD
jgi:type IV pilus assembly protein PilE